MKNKITEDTVWGDLDKSLEFLDHPAFPKKPKLSVMGYNKDDLNCPARPMVSDKVSIDFNDPIFAGGDIPGGDIEPSYKDPFGRKIEPISEAGGDIGGASKKLTPKDEGYISKEEQKILNEGGDIDPSYTDVIYEKLQDSNRQIANLTEAFNSMVNKYDTLEAKYIQLQKQYNSAAEQANMHPLLQEKM
jgi:hypothetical protein